jgi:hypothetical protein
MPNFMAGNSMYNLRDIPAQEIEEEGEMYDDQSHLSTGYQ